MLTSVNPELIRAAGISQSSWDLLNDLVAEAANAAEQKAAVDRERAAADRLRYGWEQLEAAYALPDADSLVTGGRWAGFTRGDATAWCWNLFQFESSGFTHPASQVRAEAWQLLEAGGLPEVFGYPERARQHVARGLTPRRYREYRETLGSPTFTSRDVRRR